MEVNAKYNLGLLLITSGLNPWMILRINGCLFGTKLSFGSKNKQIIPLRVVIPPKTTKNHNQSWCPLASTVSPTSIPWSKTTAIMATNGRIERTLSTFPLFVVSVVSVTKALNAESFAVLPKKVIMQSIMTIIVPDSNALCATKLYGLLGSKNANMMMEIPQMIYPDEIKIFLFPNLSDRAPINKVVIVAATAENTVI